MDPRIERQTPEQEGDGTTEPRCEEPPKQRFRLIKLEERIAPGGGHGKGSNLTCRCSHSGCLA